MYGPAYDPPLPRCPLCGDPSLQTYDRDFRGNSIDRCRDCGVKFMNPQYSDAHLQQFYSTYISVHDQRAPAPERRKSRPDLRAAGKRRCLDLMARYVTPGRVLMVGCGDGLELEIARELSWRPEGYDIDPETTSEVARRFGVPVHCGAFEDLPLPDGGYDAVFMDQVIEHPKNPADYLTKSHALLRSGGVLLLGMPNIGSLTNSLKTLASRLHLRRKWRGKHYNTKHHIFFYSPGVMRRLLGRFGFEPLVMRGSLKPQRNPVTAVLGRWLPSLDSGFVALARKP